MSEISQRWKIILRLGLGYIDSTGQEALGLWKVGDYIKGDSFE